MMFKIFRPLLRSAETSVIFYFRCLRENSQQGKTVKKKTSHLGNSIKKTRRCFFQLTGQKSALYLFNFSLQLLA
jgi:hypothetical protein